MLREWVGGGGGGVGIDMKMVDCWWFNAVFTARIIRYMETFSQKNTYTFSIKTPFFKQM